VGDLLHGRSSSLGAEPKSPRRKVAVLVERPNPFPMSIMDNAVAAMPAHKPAVRAQSGKRADMKAVAGQRQIGARLWGCGEEPAKEAPFLAIGRLGAAAPPGQGSAAGTPQASPLRARVNVHKRVNVQK
jgi:hypothetical protein